MVLSKHLLEIYDNLQIDYDFFTKIKVERSMILE